MGRQSSPCGEETQTQEGQLEAVPHAESCMCSARLKEKPPGETDGAGRRQTTPRAHPLPAQLFSPGGSGTAYSPPPLGAASSHSHMQLLLPACQLEMPSFWKITLIFFFFHFLKLEYNSFTMLFVPAVEHHESATCIRISPPS